MNDENNCQDSYISLSAFLCLDDKKQYQSINSTKNLLTASSIGNNASFFPLNGDPLSRQDQDCQDQQNINTQISGAQKKQKKQYSKNYRKKHKEYVQNLKLMNQKYEKRIQELTLKVDQMTHQIRCLKYGKQISDNLFDSTFMKQKQATLKQLVNDAQNKKQTSWDKLNKYYGQIYGVAGKQKINLLNYYMSQIIDNLLIDHNKNFILTGLSDFQINRPIAKILYQVQQKLVGFNNSEFMQLKKYLRKSMPQSLKAFHKNGQQFYSSYVKLINSAKQIQNHFYSIQQGLYQLLPADKYLAVLKWYQQNKHSKQIQMLRKQWFQSFRNK